MDIEQQDMEQQQRNEEERMVTTLDMLARCDRKGCGVEAYYLAVELGLRKQYLQYIEKVAA